jgi:uncharacterized protein
MMEAIEKLLILQDRDRNIMQLRGELVRIEPQRQMFNARTSGAQTNLDAAKNRAKQLESDRKKLELEVESKKQQIEKYANQQFQTKKNEEYRALAHEIELCKQAIVKLDDQQIELMEQAEGAQKEVQAANQALAEAKKVADGQVTELGKREENLKKELEGLESTRATSGCSRTRVRRWWWACSTACAGAAT